MRGRHCPAEGEAQGGIFCREEQGHGERQEGRREGRGREGGRRMGQGASGPRGGSPTRPEPEGPSGWFWRARRWWLPGRLPVRCVWGGGMEGGAVLQPLELQAVREGAARFDRNSAAQTPRHPWAAQSRGPSVRPTMSSTACVPQPLALQGWGPRLLRPCAWPQGQGAAGSGDQPSASDSFALRPQKPSVPRSSGGLGVRGGRGEAPRQEGAAEGVLSQRGGGLIDLLFL